VINGRYNHIFPRFNAKFSRCVLNGQSWWLHQTHSAVVEEEGEDEEKDGR
jgi:hypothetical protein